MEIGDIGSVALDLIAGTWSGRPAQNIEQVLAQLPDTFLKAIPSALSGAAPQ